MKQFAANLKRQAEENPLMALAITAALFTATSKLLDSNTAARSARTHAIEVNRRVALATR